MSSKETKNECKTKLITFSYPLNVQFESEKLFFEYLLCVDEKGKNMPCPSQTTFSTVFDFLGLEKHLSYSSFQQIMKACGAERLSTFLKILSTHTLITLLPTFFAQKHDLTELNLLPSMSHWNTGAHFTQSFHSEKPVFLAGCTADQKVIISSSKYIVSICNDLGPSALVSPHRWEILLGPRSFEEANARLNQVTGMIYLFDPLIETQMNTSITGFDKEFGYTSPSLILVLLNSYYESLTLSNPNAQVFVDSKSTIVHLQPNTAKVTQMSDETVKWWRLGVPSIQELEKLGKKKRMRKKKNKKNKKSG